MPETIGQRLKQAREEKRLTLEKAAEATRVRLPYLQALENDDYSVMVSAAQGRGFLRLYADYLGLDLDEIVSSVKAAAPALVTDDSAPQAEAASEPTPAAEPPASTSAPKPARPGFWSRLLRRSAPAPYVPEPEPQPEPQIESAAPALVDETPVVPVIVETEMPAAEEPAIPAKRTRRAASDTEPKKKPRVAASKKKLSTR